MSIDVLLSIFFIYGTLHNGYDTFFMTLFILFKSSVLKSDINVILSFILLFLSINSYNIKLTQLSASINFIMERMREIESPSQPWQGHILTTKLHPQNRYIYIVS